MTVKELIAKLENLDADAMVVVPAQYGGLDEIAYVETESVIPEPNPCERSGKWTTFCATHDENKDKLVSAVTIW